MLKQIFITFLAHVRRFFVLFYPDLFKYTFFFFFSQNLRHFFTKFSAIVLPSGSGSETHRCYFGVLYYSGWSPQQECGLCHDIFMKECAVHIHVRQAASQLTVVFNGFYPSFCFEKVGHRSACLVFQEPVQLPAACSAITIFRF